METEAECSLEIELAGLMIPSPPWREGKAKRSHSVSWGPGGLYPSSTRPGRDYLLSDDVFKRL